jgi:hypothetical protein
MPHVTAWNKGSRKYESEEAKNLAAKARRKERRSQRNTQEFISDRIRTLIRNSLHHRGITKDTKTATLLGCSVKEFAYYLESKFSDGMTWANYGNKPGNWNIDHILPLASFDLRDEEQQKAAFHYSNCRPLWAVENFKKGSRLSDESSTLDT